MKRKKRLSLVRIGRVLGAVAVAAMAAACGGGGGSAEVVDSDTPVTGPVAPQPKNTEGRLLASNCFQCHGTGGTGGFESIRGKEAAEVLAYLGRTASLDIMAAHAQGYTPAQLQSIVNYLQQ